MLDILAEIFWLGGDIIFVALYIGLFKRWNRKQEWSGVVVKNKKKRVRSMEKYRFVVVFRTADGSRRKLRMTQEQAAFYKSGWRYYKKKGEDLPGINSGMEHHR
jgi:hypothetical protein